MKRRSLLAGGLAATLPTRIFAQTAASARPLVLQGVQSGDFFADGAIVWSRADRPARMVVEYATTENFAHARRIEGPMAQPAGDFTTHVRLTGVAPGQTVFYRVSYAALDDPSAA
jgi:alkaline phosphatase D